MPNFLKRNILYSLIFLSFLLSMKLWLGWEGRLNAMNYTIGVLLLLVVLIFNIKLSFNKQNISFFVLFVIATLLVVPLGYGFILYFLPYFIIIFLNDNDKSDCLTFITKWYGYLMIPSLLVFLVASNVDIPHLGFQYANENEWALQNNYGVCKNYIFYMKSDFSNYGNRFNGPFLEPGHLGMMSAFLLMVNQFDFRKKGMKSILFSILFTLSLAAYILLIIGWLLIMYYKHKLELRYLLLFLLSFAFLYIFAMTYNEGDNVIYENFFGRLEYDEEKGFSGNNRVFGEIYLYFDFLWKDTHTMLWGYPKETMEWLAESGSRGTGYVMWICKYGLMGLGIVILMYLCPIVFSENKKYFLLLFIFVALMFWQRCYPFWSSWIICFLYGYSYNSRTLGKNNENRNTNVSS